MNDLGDTRDGGVMPGPSSTGGTSGPDTAAATRPQGWVERVTKDRRQASAWTAGVIVACPLAGGIAVAVAAASPAPATPSGHAAAVGSGGEAALLSATLNAAGTAGSAPASVRTCPGALRLRRAPSPAATRGRAPGGWGLMVPET